MYSYKEGVEKVETFTFDEKPPHILNDILPWQIHIQHGIPAKNSK